ncbi:hypothetical protein B0H67DRAFT_638177 [Lasiosphaeris hirsuta]|uniref:Rhodopsin domain-containing protein n=1 Tax=Lasiosphaeris hirsuta TaxID=260670 RepID=A0AA40EBR9_9PEZI|nr:hypothetical protein B0H67DRAFT_638177 [Lasiosphaeris hirsuta]
MTLYSSPPLARPFSDDKPTVLVSWWMASFCTVIITLRIAGRYIRVEKLFVEDKIAALALIPMFLRMAFVHVVLLFGTNNVLVEDDGLRLSVEEIRRRKIGSSLVLVTRLLHPATVWILKAVTLEFFGRLVMGQKKYKMTFWSMRAIFFATFGAVIVSDLAECRPFSDYWTVFPDPGGQCRQGYATFVTTAVGSILTDVLLVVFPVPIIASIQLSLGRKVVLMLLFCLGLLNVIITAYRIPQVLGEHGYQGTRSMWASVEILIATGVANALALGSFVRDTGAKKAKFKQHDPHDGSIPTQRGQRGQSDLERGRAKINSMISERDTSAESSVSSPLSSSSARDAAVLNRTASRDSLIPRSQLSTYYHGDGANHSSGVVKTTTIRVTITDPVPGRDSTSDEPRAGTPRMVMTPVVRSKSASGTGVGRGSTVVLQEMRPMPARNVSPF